MNLSDWKEMRNSESPSVTVFEHRAWFQCAGCKESFKARDLIWVPTHTNFKLESGHKQFNGGWYCGPNFTGECCTPSDYMYGTSWKKEMKRREYAVRM